VLRLTEGSSSQFEKLSHSGKRFVMKYETEEDGRKERRPGGKKVDHLRSPQKQKTSSGLDENHLEND